jgi:hydroxypyruvate reductase
VRFIAAGHPRPDPGSLRAGASIARLLRPAGERDLVLAVLSGGGSALMEHLNPGLTLGELQKLTDDLLRSGAPIDDLNCVRKHLSQIKGGGLARMAHPARVLALILSDVIGDPLDVIASGPTAPDPTMVEEAAAILARYGLARAGPLAALRETAKPGDPVFERVTNRMVGSNALAREAAAAAARSLGFEVRLPQETVRGEARQFGERLVQRLGRETLRPPAAVILGGETTVTVKGNGVGGRNQELALAAAIVLDGDPRPIAVASIGTDGVDGPTPAAGAIATPGTLARARALGLDPWAMLANNDAYSFFNALGDCLVTGPTGTNVNDLVIVLVYG